MTINWDEIKTRKIREAFRKALIDDSHLSHSEVVEVLRATLADGDLTGEEVADLIHVAKGSETITPRSALMLVYLLNQYVEVFGSNSPLTLSNSRQQYAAGILLDFMKLTGAPYFPNLNRDVVGIELLMRVAKPGIISQSPAGLCGPVSFLYSLVTDSPAAYAKFAIDLYEKGKARIGRVEVQPGFDCRNYSPPAPMSQAEWLTAASLRDSENFLLDFDDVSRNFSASTTTSEMAVWFKRAGYTDVRYDDNLLWSRGAGDIVDFNQFYNSGYRVVLRINSKMLKKEKQADTSGSGNHFVVLRSPIVKSGLNVSLTVFTWGRGEYQIPQGDPLKESDFLGNLYGYVMAKPF